MLGFGPIADYVHGDIDRAVVDLSIHGPLLFGTGGSFSPGGTGGKVWSPGGSAGGVAVSGGASGKVVG